MEMHTGDTDPWMHTELPEHCPWSRLSVPSASPTTSTVRNDCSCCGEPSAGKILFCQLAVEDLVSRLAWIAQFDWIG